jgi:hypothetical protein
MTKERRERKFQVNFCRIEPERIRDKDSPERRLRVGEGEVDGGALTDLAFEPELTTMGLH